MPTVGDPIGKAVVELTLDDKSYDKGLKGAEKSLGKFDKKMQKTAGRMGKAFLAGGLIVGGALAGLVRHAARAGDELDKMSLRTGESVENLSRLSFAADISGTSIQAVEVGIRRLSRNMNDFKEGIGEAADAFKTLGIDVTTPEGALRTNLEVIKDIADAINELTSETEKTALAQELFGRSGANLLPLLKQGEAGIQSLMDRADELGIVMSTRAASAAAEFTDKMTEMTTSLKMAGFQLGSALLPAVQTSVETLTDAIARFNSLEDDKKKLIGYGAAITAFLGIFTGIGLLAVSKIAALTAGFKLLGPAIASVAFATAAAGALALGTSIWAVKRALDAWNDPLNFARGQVEGLKLANEGMAKTIRTIKSDLEDLQQFGWDPSTVAIADLKTSVGDLNKTLNESGGTINRFTQWIRGTGESVDLMIPPLANAVDVIELLEARLADTTEKGNDLRDTVAGISRAEDTATESTKDFDAALADLRKSLLDDPGETWFLRVMKETQELTRPPPAIDIDPKTRGGIAAYIQSVIDMAEAHNKLGDRLDENREKLGLDQEDAKFRMQAAAAHEAEANAALDNAEALAKELDRLAAEASAKELDRIVRRNDLSEKDHQNSIDAAIKLTGILDAEERKRQATRTKIDKEDERKAKADARELKRAQERQADEALRAWERAKDGIEDIFEDLFTDFFRDGKIEWGRFIDGLVNTAITKLSQITFDKTLGPLLDRLAGVAPKDVRLSGARQETGGPRTGEDVVAEKGTEPKSTEGLQKILSKLIPIAGTIVPPLIGLLVQNQQEKERFRQEREGLRDRLKELNFSQQEIASAVQRLTDQQNRIFREDIPLAQRPGSRSLEARRRSIFEARRSATGGASLAPAALERDTFIRIDRLELNMPPTIQDMSRPELDRQTARQLDSIARGFRRDPRARRGFLR